jgi:hypothetical protein
MAEPKIAKRVAVKDLAKYVDRVTEALGRKGALVTDESIVSDLLESGENPHKVRRGEGPWEDRPGSPEVKKLNDWKLAEAMTSLGIPFERKEAIVVVAHRLKNFERGGKS